MSCFLENLSNPIEHIFIEKGKVQKIHVDGIQRKRKYFELFLEAFNTKALIYND